MRLLANLGGSFALLTLVTGLLVFLGIVFFSKLRDRYGGDASSTAATRQRDAQRRFLTENWEMVERTARESGMSDEELAKVRASLLGL